MSNIHVCLISDQTIPNILSVAHFKPDEVLFISTEEMEDKNKSKHIVETLKLLNFNLPIDLIKVTGDSISDCRTKLEKWIKGKEDNTFTVNLTGGTKIMSLAAFEFFREYSSTMIYIPFPKNEYSIIFPKRSDTSPKPINLKLSVKQYLQAYKLKVFNENKLEEKKKKAIERKDISKWITKNYNNLLSLLERFSEKLRTHRNDKFYEWHTEYKPANEFEKELFFKLGFVEEKGDYKKIITKDEIEYITGGWLEEYCFNELNDFIGKGIDDIVINILAGTEQRKNEYDVVFTKDNALYTIECKSLSQDHDTKAEILYKIGALQNDFGLKTGSFLVSTSPHLLKDGDLKPSVKARAEQFKTTVIKPDEVINLKEIIAEKLKLKG